jgi:hypothetical protein
MCPVSLTKIDATTVVAHSYDLVCPGCGRHLEVSRISRNLSMFAGLIAGYGVWYWSTQAAANHQALGWVFPILFAIVAFGIVTPLVLMLTADLSLKTELSPPEISTHADAGHGAAHH